MKTTWLRNTRTVGTCGAPGCHDEARLFPGGWFCSVHRPAPAQVVRHPAVVR